MRRLPTSVKRNQNTFLYVGTCFISFIKVTIIDEKKKKGIFLVGQQK